MTTHRFFVHPDWIERNLVIVTGPLVHQLRNVLRMRRGDGIVVLDNSGWEYQVELDEVAKERVVGRITHKRLAIGEPRTKVRLYQGVLRGRHFEWVLQKGTELGIVEFVPVICDRCLMSSLDDISSEKMTRWQRIVLEAAEQSNRGRLPRLHDPILFSQACEQTRREGLSIMLWEGERSISLRDALQAKSSREYGQQGSSANNRRPFSVSLQIGPEGGLTNEESELASRYGVQMVTLGPRILRAETAGLVAATAVLYEFGDLAYTET